MADYNAGIPSFVPGPVLAADLDALSLALLALYDTRSAYVPVLSTTGTAPNLGNGTITGRYARLGKTVFFRIVFIVGSTTTFGTGALLFTLPIAPLADQIVAAMLNDASASNRFAGKCWIINATTGGDNMRIIFSGESPFANMTGTSPLALATGDKLILQGHYEAT